MFRWRSPAEFEDLHRVSGLVIKSARRAAKNGKPRDPRIDKIEQEGFIELWLDSYDKACREMNIIIIAPDRQMFIELENFNEYRFEKGDPVSLNKDGRVIPHKSGNTLVGYFESYGFLDK